MHIIFFAELKNLTYFQQLKSIGLRVAWPSEQDFSSDTILFDLQPIPIDKSKPHPLV